jgi:polyphosphate kinase
VYLSSADWMPRNFYRRIEVAFPIESPKLRDEIIKEILPAFLNDRVKSRELQPDGRYVRLKPRPGEEHSQAQLFFRERSRQFFANLTKASSHAAKIIPIEAERLKAEV